MSFAKSIGNSLQDSIYSFNIFRTTVRIAASNAGIPAEINDDISWRSGDRVRKLKNIDDILLEHERLLREYCKVIREKKTCGYSNDIQCALYYLENNYMNEINIKELAENLNLSPSSLSERFKEETGTTPTQYLISVRIKQAKDRLIRSQDSISDVAAEIGIYDTNYFARLFKKVTGETPLNYRRIHKM